MNKRHGRDPADPCKTIVMSLGPGDKGYVAPVTDFLTVEFHNGFVTVSAEYYKKLTKRKQAKLIDY